MTEYRITHGQEVEDIRNGKEVKEIRARGIMRIRRVTALERLKREAINNSRCNEAEKDTANNNHRENQL